MGSTEHHQPEHGDHTADDHTADAADDHTDGVVGSRPGRMTARRIVTAMVATGTLAVAACSGGAEEPEGSAAPADDEQQSELAFSDVGDEAEDEAQEASIFAFEAPELYTGELQNGFGLYMDAPTIITFVDPSCPICLDEAPILAESAENNPEVNYVVVHGFGHTEGYLDFNSRAELFQENMLHLVDNSGALWNRFDINSQPAAILVDQDGQIQTAIGAMGDTGFEDAVELIRNPVPIGEGGDEESEGFLFDGEG